MTSFAWGSASDVGQVRKANEDSMLTIDGLFVVADGMGGHRGGAVASSVAVETMAQCFTDRTTDGLVSSVEKANASIVERSTGDPELEGMGTTLCALALVKGAEEFDGRDLLGVVNVGDSRLYLLKEGELQQITEDHSLVATLERQGRLTRAEAAVHPQRNVLTRALGIDERVMVDSWEIVPFVGDRYLLCSDGLFNEVDIHRIEATLRKLSDPGEAAHELVRLANGHGGRDNITCVVVDIVEDDTAHQAVVDGEGERIAHTVHGPERVMAAAQGSTVTLPSREPSGGDGERGGDDARSGSVASDVASGTARETPGDEGDPGSATPSDRSDGPRRPKKGSKKRSKKDPTDELDPEIIEIQRTTRFTWRVVVFALAFTAVIAVIIGSVIYVGTSSYYVGFDDDQVAIYRGRVGGVLWIEPRLVEHTDLSRDEIPAAYLADIEAGREQPSLDSARRYVDNIRELSQSRESVNRPPPPDPGASDPGASDPGRSNRSDPDSDGAGAGDPTPS